MHLARRPRAALRHLVLVLLVALPSVATAGSFASRFNSPPVAGVTLSGDAAYVGGHVQLTAAANGQSGQMLLNDLDPGESIDAFSAHCQVFIGGGSGADGMSFSFGDPSSITSAVDGVNTGLAVSLDTFNNGGGDVFNAVQVRYNGASIATSGALTLRTGSYVNLDVVVRQDGLITVFHNTTFAISATIPGWSGVAGRRFVFNAATGGLNDEHSIEDVVIATTSAADFRSTFDSPPVSGVNLFGNAIYDAGAVKLTTTSPGGQQGAMILNDLDAGAAIQRFAATVRFGIGAGSGADGMSFAFGDLPSASFGEEGTGNGLILRFDTFGGGGDFVNEIEVVYAGAHVAASGVRTIRTGDFRDVVITMSANGRLAVAHQNSTNSSVPLIEVTIPGWAPQAGWRFGIGGRTGGLTDNHWVEDLAIETIACGNGALEDGEACDAGAANGTATSCCSSTCTFVTAGTQCRASAGVCDPAETCTGSSAACPADGKSTAECRASAGACDVAESCDGVNSACPADGFTAGGTECRAPAGVCDVAEACTGSSAACPADGKSTAECRASAGACDVAESCDGVNDACPADAHAPDGTSCDDGQSCTVLDVCAAGSCGGDPITCGDGSLQPACGEQCDDGGRVPGDGCDAACRLEICPASPRSNCVESARVKFQFVERSVGREQMKVEWKAFSEATTTATFGDPVSGANSVAICIYGDAGNLVQRLEIDRGGESCAGAPCWRAIGSTGLRYKDRSASASGVQQLDFVAAEAGRGKASAKGRNDAGKGMTSLPTGVAARLSGESHPTLQLATEHGFCLSAEVTTVRLADGQQYKAERR